jgi:hypothetical protein
MKPKLPGMRNVSARGETPNSRERLKIQFAKMVNAICRTMDLRIDGDQEKIDKYFDEHNHEIEIPKGTKLTSRFDVIEESHGELKKTVDDYISRPWWRRFLGIGPKKKKVILKIGSHDAV